MVESKTCCQRIPVKRSDFGLNWKDPGALARSQWPIPTYAYIVYRSLFMMYLVVWDTLNVCSGTATLGARQLLYLTNWSFHVLTLYGIVGALSSAVYCYRPQSSLVLPRQSSTRGKEGIQNDAFVSSDDDVIKMASRQEGGSMDVDENGKEIEGKPSGRASNQGTPKQAPDPLTPWYLKLSWALFNINVMVAPLVTVVYWSVLHDYSPPEEGEVRNPLNVGLNVNVHAMNGILIILDLFVSAHPIRIVHWIYGLAYGFVYIVFTVIYWAAGGVNSWGGTAIYPILDWGEIPGLTCAYVLAIALAIGVIQCIVYALFRLRVYISMKCNRNQSAKAVDITSTV
ncbi:protein rolling stone-like [Diadema antillarum]|uniref:protein rolling stone-like n=1 Tax=Diadema antillarum TaxID=105358 RepID=UPI003A86E64D